MADVVARADPTTGDIESLHDAVSGHERIVRQNTGCLVPRVILCNKRYPRATSRVVTETRTLVLNSSTTKR